MEICHFFFFNDTATTEIYTLSLHDALPISHIPHVQRIAQTGVTLRVILDDLDTAKALAGNGGGRSEEHTSELQSPCNLVCRLLLEKKMKWQLPGHPIIAPLTPDQLNLTHGH